MTSAPTAAVATDLLTAPRPLVTGTTRLDNRTVKVAPDRVVYPCGRTSGSETDRLFLGQLTPYGNYRQGCWEGTVHRGHRKKGRLPDKNGDQLPHFCRYWIRTSDIHGRSASAIPAVPAAPYYPIGAAARAAGAAPIYKGSHRVRFLTSTETVTESAAIRKQ